MDKAQKIAIISAAVLLIGMGALIYRNAHRDLITTTLLQKPSTNATPSPHVVWVHVAGAVARPGVYQVAEGERVMAVIKQAGGVLPQANIDSVKLVARVKDGQTIKVKFKEPPRGSKSLPSEAGVLEFPISIDHIDANLLFQIPGLSGAVVDRIIAYREANPFMRKSDLRRIKGVGEKTYQKLDPYIRD